MKKINFLNSKFGQKIENRKFYREFVLESSDGFARTYFPYSHPKPLESTFPPLLAIHIPDFENFENNSLNFDF